MPMLLYFQRLMLMLQVLGDIEIAQGMKREDEGSQVDMEEVDHPLDVDYGHLDTTLELVDKKSKEFEVSITDLCGSIYILQFAVLKRCIIRFCFIRQCYRMLIKSFGVGTIKIFH